MRSGETARAFGHFNVLFAELDEYVTRALLDLRKHAAPETTFESLHSRGFKRNCGDLKKELRQFEGHSSVAFELERMRDALARADGLNDWRKRRIHGLVRRTDEGLALYDWETRKRLTMSEEECQQQIEAINFVALALKCDGKPLSNHLDWCKLFDDFWNNEVDSVS